MQHVWGIGIWTSLRIFVYADQANRTRLAFPQHFLWVHCLRLQLWSALFLSPSSSHENPTEEPGDSPLNSAQVSYLLPSCECLIQWQTLSRACPAWADALFVLLVLQLAHPLPCRVRGSSLASFCPGCAHPVVPPLPSPDLLPSLHFLLLAPTAFRSQCHGL